MRSVLFALALWLLGGVTANAACTCQCVDGQLQPLCQSAIDQPPVCAPTICPIAAPSLPPLTAPILPPLGTSQCRQAQICDPLGKCQWQQVCD
jgi:hypothetical protein